MEKFQVAELNNAIKTFDPTTSPDPDGILELMIVGLRNTAKLFLLNLFNQSWALGKLPLEWKRAIVVPIFKPGKEADNSENFRPMSLNLLSSVCGLRPPLFFSRPGLPI
ncbi:hypothetical protein TNCV_3104411 [Trichonephila clavipes]|nr:hypothetical protein TNCV_3104411 [Trichonephila clavipes]